MNGSSLRFNRYECGHVPSVGAEDGHIFQAHEAAGGVTLVFNSEPSPLVAAPEHPGCAAPLGG